MARFSRPRPSSSSGGAEYRDNSGYTGWPSDSDPGTNGPSTQHFSSSSHGGHSSLNISRAKPYTLPRPNIQQPNPARQRELRLASTNTTMPANFECLNDPDFLCEWGRSGKGSGSDVPCAIRASYVIHSVSPSNGVSNLDLHHRANRLYQDRLVHTGQFHRNEYPTVYPSGGPTANGIPTADGIPTGQAPHPNYIGLRSPPATPPDYPLAPAILPAVTYATSVVEASRQYENGGAHHHMSPQALPSYNPAQSPQAWSQTKGYDEAAYYSPAAAYPSPSSVASRSSEEPAEPGASRCHSAPYGPPPSHTLTRIDEFGSISGPYKAEYARGESLGLNGLEGRSSTHFVHGDFAPQPSHNPNHTGLPALNPTIPAPQPQVDDHELSFALQSASSAIPHVPRERQAFLPSPPRTVDQFGPHAFVGGVPGIPQQTPVGPPAPQSQEPGAQSVGRSDS